MAYQAKRRKRYIQDFELVDQNGEVVKTLQVSLDADDMVARLSRKYTDLMRVYQETANSQKDTETMEDYEKRLEMLGNAVVDLLEAVFGEEDTKTIVAFYENRYVEMCKEVVPFITQCVIPRCAEIKRENQKSILQSYNRKQRRTLFKRGL